MEHEYDYIAILEEFVAHVNDAYPEDSEERLSSEWPDLFITYEKAQEAIIEFRKGIKT